MWLRSGNTISQMLSLLLLVILTFLLFKCENLPNKPDYPYNEYDPNNPGYEIPSISFLAGPKDGETIIFSEVKFKWVGSKSNMEFSYRLDNNYWTEFSTSDSVVYEYLPDGKHIFFVYGRYINNDYSIVETITFYIKTSDFH
jgi:hypothetical protein